MVKAKDHDLEDFRDVCFVIIPFGTKPVGSGKAKRTIDFDRIYRDLFNPATWARLSVQEPAAPSKRGSR